MLFVPPNGEVELRLIVMLADALMVKTAVVVFAFNVAVIVDVRGLPTTTVDTLNGAVVAPPGTTTVAGTVADELDDVRPTVRPPAGAGLLIVRVAADGFPPTTAVGFKASDTRVGVVIVKALLAVWPFAEAPILAVTSAATALVGILNVTVVAPAATVTVAGTVALALSEVKATDRPPVGAGPLMVTVATEGVPPATDVGFSETPLRTAELTVRAAEAVPALIVAVFDAVTGTVVTVKVVDVEPAGTVTEAGTVAEASVELVATVSPPVGAGPAMVTVAVDNVPPVTVVGFSVRPVTVGDLTVMFTVDVLPFRVAVIAPTALTATGVVVTVELTPRAPAGIVTEAGTVAAGLVEDRLTTNPPAGAAVGI